VKLAPIPNNVAEAAQRLRKLDNSKTVYGSNQLHVAFSGGLGAKVRNQVVADLDAVLEAVLGRPPTLTELSAVLKGGDAA
jgi:hypothetical protein